MAWGFRAQDGRALGVDGSGFGFCRFHVVLEGVYPGPETYTLIIPRYACITPYVIPGLEPREK